MSGVETGKEVVDSARGGWRRSTPPSLLIRVTEGACNRLASLAHLAHLASWRESVVVPMPTNIAEEPFGLAADRDELTSICG